MHTDTDHLKTLAIEIAERQNPVTITESKADHRLLYETNKLEKGITQALRAIDNFTQRDTLHNDVLGKLVEICDILYIPNRRVTPDAQAVLDLIRDIRKIIPGITSPLLDLPKAFIHEQREVIKGQWQTFEDVLNKYEIDKELITISAIPFKRFIDGKDKLYWSDFTWLKGYIAKLDAANWDHADCNSPTEALMSLLIGRDFNHDQFYVYCKQYIQQRVANVNTRQRRLQEYNLCKKLVIQDTQPGLPAFDRHSNTVSDRLLKWITEEGNALKAGDGAEYIGKLSVIWNIETLALFFKLLWDNKVFRDVTLELFSEQIAAAFSSKGKGDFKAHSIFGRFYVKDPEVLRALESLLLKMLADIRLYLK